MTRPTEDKPATVPMAQQAGAARPRWWWVKPSVWTMRMLTTLEQGIEGGQWFRLFDKVFAERNLFAAFQQVAKKKGAAGIDHVSVTQFGLALPESLWEVADQLKNGTFTYPSRGPKKHGRWASRRFAIGWSRRRW
jgi:hypothetical protein